MSAAPARVLRDDAGETVQGILLVAGSYVLLTGSDIGSKWALPAAGLALVMLGRGLGGTATVIALQARSGTGWGTLVPVRWRLVALRSVLHSLVSLCYYVAWLSVPLADTYAITFTAPLLMTLLAIPLLGERIRWRRALSTGFGFLGVLVMLRPGGDLWSSALLVLLPGVAMLAVSRIMTRQLSTTESPACLTFWLMAAHIVTGSLLFIWVPPAAAFWTLPLDVIAAAVLHGVLNAAAHWLMARGYALAPVSAVAPYEYTTLIWGGLLAWAVFHEVPAWSTLAGAAVVAAAGLYNLHRERVRRAVQPARIPP